MSYLLFVLGLVAIVGGAYMIHPGAAVVACGLLLIRAVTVVETDGGGS